MCAGEASGVTGLAWHVCSGERAGVSQSVRRNNGRLHAVCADGRVALLDDGVLLLCAAMCRLTVSNVAVLQVAARLAASGRAVMSYGTYCCAPYACV